MAAPGRIVSLVPSLTEALGDLGARERIAGITDYCPSPAGNPPVRRVGGPRTPKLDVIRALQPDLVIASREECREDDVQALRTDLHVVVYDCRSFGDALAVLRDLGRRLGREAAAGTAVARAEAACVVTGGEPRRIFYPLWVDPWMTISRGSFAADMLARAGGVSIFADVQDPYPTVTLAAAADRDPEIILLPDEPYRFRPADRERFRDFRAYAAGRIRCVPGRWAAWYGTRMDEGLAGLRRALARTP